MFIDKDSNHPQWVTDIQIHALIGKKEYKNWLKYKFYVLCSCKNIISIFQVFNNWSEWFPIQEIVNYHELKWVLIY